MTPEAMREEDGIWSGRIDDFTRFSAFYLRRIAICPDLNHSCFQSPSHLHFMISLKLSEKPINIQ
jgi:hypothetical protein